MAKCEKISVLFCCMGNICRSPTAEAVFRHYVQKANLENQFFIDSAGTHDYHIGHPPDSRTQRAAKKRGFDLSRLRGVRWVSKISPSLIIFSRWIMQTYQSCNVCCQVIRSVI